MKYNSRSYSNKKLIYLCKKKKIRFESGHAPWINFESENTSFGKCFRKLAFYPKFLPLFISSDHGVSWSSKIDKREKETIYPYFTWNKKKYLELKKLNKKVYFIKHPWIYYKEKYLDKKNLKKKREGTLVFFLHSNSHVKAKYFNLAKYINQLKKLDKKFHPISIALYQGDINQKLHLKLRKYKINLVTTGNVNSQNFIDHFYDLISNFEFVSSPTSSSTIGSHFFYSINAGINFFFFGKRVKYENINLKSYFSKKKYMVLSDYGFPDEVNKIKLLEKLFSKKGNNLSNKKINLINEYMGYKASMSRVKISLIVWLSLFKNILTCVKIYFFLIKMKFV